jgi:hypothetical protein
VPRLEKAAVEGSLVVGLEDVHNVASPEEVIAHMEGKVHKAEACQGCGTVAEGIVGGSSSRAGKVACSHYTWAQLEDMADSGCKASSFPYLAAYSAALPADDDRSSCRLREMLPNRSRRLRRLGSLRAATDSSRVDAELFWAVDYQLMDYLTIKLQDAKAEER